MRVIHLSLTPLAGAPIRIVNALNRHTDTVARLIDFDPERYGRRVFPEDLVWKRDRDESLAALAEADLVVAHHFFDFRSNPFGVDLTRVVRPTCRFVRQFHSSIASVCRFMNVTEQEIRGDPCPKLVIPHCPERSFLDARIVPNIVPIQEEAYRPLHEAKPKPVIFFSATYKDSCWTWRWETKGYPEVVRLLKRQRDSADLDIVYGAPFDECLRRKRRSDIAIDDLATGSYHLTSLESLAQGIPTLSYLDNRTQNVLCELVGADRLPFVNVHWQEAEPVLRELLADASLRREIGCVSREWMERYYSEAAMVKHHVKAYQDVLDGADFHGRPALSAAERWLEIDLYDRIWEGRRNRALSAWRRRFLNFYTGPYERLKRRIRKFLARLKK